jgi:acyl-CoA synthetase (AMP-forming)/AMP-acid ligase II
MDRLHALTLADMLREHARSRPFEIAVVGDDQRLTWPELDERVSRLANVLEDSAVGTGDVVLWLGQNSHRLLEGLLACAKIGAVFCAANWRQSADELAWLLGDAAPAVVLWQETQIGETVLAARTRAGDTARWLQHDGDGDDGYETVIAKASGKDREADVDPASPVLMLYTAAFEGRPKGALLSHSALLHQALVTALVQEVDAAYVFLNSGPLFHVATLMTTMATFHLGGRNVFTATAEAEDLCRLIDAERCTGAFLMPPTVGEIAELNADGRYDLSSLRSMRMGNEAFDAMVTKGTSPWIRRPGEYGQTEVTGLATYAALGGQAFVSGRTSPVAQVRIVDPDGREVPPGETGEIVVRGPLVMSGYHGHPDETARRQRDGWHHTGDLGRREPDGLITFVGPMTRIVKTGAENVYPAEVEACLQRHPGVREAAVLGVPDPQWGQNVKAVVVADRNRPPTPDDLVAHCRDHIASYKKPKVIEFVDRLPRTATGLVDRDAIDAAHGGGGYPGTG